MIRRPPRSTRTDTLFPYTTLFRSASIFALRASPPERARLSALRLNIGKTQGIRLRISPPRIAPPSAVQNSVRSEEHTSELQSLIRISYAVFCLQTKKAHKPQRPQS